MLIQINGNAHMCIRYDGEVAPVGVAIIDGRILPGAVFAHAANSLARDIDILDFSRFEDHAVARDGSVIY